MAANNKRYFVIPTYRRSYPFAVKDRETGKVLCDAFGPKQGSRERMREEARHLNAEHEAAGAKRLLAAMFQEEHS